MKMAGSKLKAQSIAFPAFTNRKFKVPLELVCKTMFRTFIKYVDANQDKTTLREINMIIASERSRMIFESNFKASKKEFENRAQA